MTANTQPHTPSIASITSLGESTQQSAITFSSAQQQKQAVAVALHGSTTPSQPRPSHNGSLTESPSGQQLASHVYSPVPNVALRQGRNARRRLDFSAALGDDEEEDHVAQEQDPLVWIENSRSQFIKQMKEKYGFDFEKGQPLESDSCRWQWQRQLST